MYKYLYLVYHRYHLLFLRVTFNLIGDLLEIGSLTVKKLFQSSTLGCGIFLGKNKIDFTVNMTILILL